MVLGWSIINSQFSGLNYGFPLITQFQIDLILVGLLSFSSEKVFLGKGGNRKEGDGHSHRSESCLRIT